MHDKKIGIYISSRSSPNVENMKITFDQALKEGDVQMMLDGEVIDSHRWAELQVISNEDEMLGGGTQASHNVSLQNFGGFFHNHDLRFQCHQ